MNDLGYTLYPPRRPSEPGYPRLDVFLRHIPTEHHFDPLKVYLDVVTPRVGVSRLIVVHPWPSSEVYQVCAGPVELTDHKGKHLDVFTFGGSLQVEPEEDHTTLFLTSPAPIMLTAESSLDRLLVEEAEILLAQRQAAQEQTHHLFDLHLIEASPLVLYRAMLAAILERYRHIPPGEDELILKFKHTLKVELEALEQEHADLPIHSIEDLL